MVAAEDPWFGVLPVMAVIYGVSAAVASVVDNYVDPLFIWGGTDCHAVDGIEACTGVVPAGLILIALVVGVCVLALAGLWRTT